MNSIDSSRLLAMRTAILENNGALQRASGLDTSKVAGDPQAAEGSGFGAALKSAIHEVNGLQDKANTISEAYERGEVTDIAAVMLSRQQASIGFEATMQVRNKLLSAYKDIMSMPV
jgi:flagellar hook-basal body complex protein FliE